MLILVTHDGDLSAAASKMNDFRIDLADCLRTNSIFFVQLLEKKKENTS